ncbi:MAG: hypothetical protein HKL80_03275 [Acidimicrobiales bacterium]|nr:hypothetical protein [Acidimicrobiales bacterium]
MAVTGSTDHITSLDLKYSRDAGNGIALANFIPNLSDPTYVDLTIRYADGVTEETGIHNMIAFGGRSIWHLAIGSNWT